MSQKAENTAKKRAQGTMGNVVNSRGITAQHSGNGSSGFLLRMCVPSPASSSRILVLVGRRCTRGTRALSGGAWRKCGVSVEGWACARAVNNTWERLGGTSRARGARQAPQSPWAGGAEPGQKQVLGAGRAVRRPCARPCLQLDPGKRFTAAGGESAFLTLTENVLESSGGGSAVEPELGSRKD